MSPGSWSDSDVACAQTLTSLALEPCVRSTVTKYESGKHARRQIDSAVELILRGSTVWHHLGPALLK